MVAQTVFESQRLIDHPEHVPLIIIRPHYLDIVGGKGKKRTLDVVAAAALLGVFEYWTMLRKRKAESSPKLRSGWEWIIKSLEQLSDVLLDMFGTKTLRAALGLLSTQKLISIRENPMLKVDRKRQYRFEVDAVRAAISHWCDERATDGITAHLANMPTDNANMPSGVANAPNGSAESAESVFIESSLETPDQNVIQEDSAAMVAATPDTLTEEDEDLTQEYQLPPDDLTPSPDEDPIPPSSGQPSLAPRTEVVNIRSQGVLEALRRGDVDYVYCGRDNSYYGMKKAIWHNPYKLEQGKDTAENRREAIRQFEAYLRGKPELMARLPELRGKKLVCFCHPEPCHCDVLAALADALPVPGAPIIWNIGDAAYYPQRTGLDRTQDTPAVVIGLTAQRIKIALINSPKALIVTATSLRQRRRDGEREAWEVEALAAQTGLVDAKPPLPQSALTKAMFEGIPEAIRPLDAKPHYGKNDVPAQVVLRAGYTAEQVGLFTEWLYATDPYYRNGRSNGAPVIVTMHDVAKLIKGSWTKVEQWNMRRQAASGQKGADYGSSTQSRDDEYSKNSSVFTPPPRK